MRRARRPRRDAGQRLPGGLFSHVIGFKRGSQVEHRLAAQRQLRLAQMEGAAIVDARALPEGNRVEDRSRTVDAIVGCEREARGDFASDSSTAVASAAAGERQEISSSLLLFALLFDLAVRLVSILC